MKFYIADDIIHVYTVYLVTFIDVNCSLFSLSPFYGENIITADIYFT